MITLETLDSKVRAFVIEPLFKEIIERVGEGYEGDLLTFIKQDREVHSDTYEHYGVELSDEEIVALLPQYLEFIEGGCRATIRVEEKREGILETALQRLRDDIHKVRLTLDNVNKTREWLKRQ